MKKLRLATLLALSLLSGLAQADRLDDIKKNGVLRVAAFDSNPPFGFIDPQTRQIATWTSITPRNWRSASASSSSWCRPIRPIAFRC